MSHFPVVSHSRTQDKAKSSEEVLRKQSENNLKALDTLMAENKRLKQEVRVLACAQTLVTRSQC